MAQIVQASLAQNSFPGILTGTGYALVDEMETILTQGTRSVTLAYFTVMSYIAGTQKWTPWITGNLGDNTGLQYPMGIYLGDTIPFATLAAGDVLRCPILVGGDVLVDINQLVFDLGPTGVLAALTLNSVPTVPTGLAMTGKQILAMRGIYVAGTLAGDFVEH
jgi:hypothetical protein